MNNKIISRVMALMMDQGLDTENDILVMKIAIIYLEAQKDEIEKKLEELK